MLLKIYCVLVTIQFNDNEVVTNSYEVNSYTAQDAITQVETEFNVRLNNREIKFFLIQSVICGCRGDFEPAAKTETSKIH